MAVPSLRRIGTAGRPCRDVAASFGLARLLVARTPPRCPGIVIVTSTAKIVEHRQVTVVLKKSKKKHRVA